MSNNSTIIEQIQKTNSLLNQLLVCIKEQNTLLEQQIILLEEINN